jgi:hypothetical protein
MFVDSPLNDTEPPYYERYSAFPHGSQEWKAVYRQRTAVERAL